MAELRSLCPEFAEDGPHRTAGKFREKTRSFRCPPQATLLPVSQNSRRLQPAAAVLGCIAAAQRPIRELSNDEEIGVGKRQPGSEVGEQVVAAGGVAVAVIPKLARVAFVDDTVVGVLCGACVIGPELAGQQGADTARAATTGLREDKIFLRDSGIAPGRVPSAKTVDKSGG